MYWEAGSRGTDPKDIKNPGRAKSQYFLSSLIESNWNQYTALNQGLLQTARGKILTQLRFLKLDAIMSASHLRSQKMALPQGSGTYTGHGLRVHLKGPYTCL